MHSAWCHVYLVKEHGHNRVKYVWSATVFVWYVLYVFVYCIFPDSISLIMHHEDFFKGDILLFYCFLNLTSKDTGGSAWALDSPDRGFVCYCTLGHLTPIIPVKIWRYKWVVHCILSEPWVMTIANQVSDNWSSSGIYINCRCLPFPGAQWLCKKVCIYLWDGL